MLARHIWAANCIKRRRRELKKEDEEEKKIQKISMYSYNYQYEDYVKFFNLLKMIDK